LSESRFAGSLRVRDSLFAEAVDALGPPAVFESGVLDVCGARAGLEISDIEAVSKGDADFASEM